MSVPGEGSEGVRPDSGTDTDRDAVGAASDDEARRDAVPPEPEWRRRRRLAEMFGDDRHATGKGDDWYRDQVPPHHG